MPGNSFGQLFKITTAGESHGGAVGVIVDGCPAGLAFTEEDAQIELDRRRPGQSTITTPRAEKDTIHILSGISDGVTTGTPILMLAYNEDARSEDYSDLKKLYRPGHADFTYVAKYGVRDWRGSGRASARETLARVAAGALAQKYLRIKLGVEIVSFVDTVGDIHGSVNLNSVTRTDVEKNIIRCPDNTAAQKMIALVEQVRQEKDSIGGTIQCVIRNVPTGLGEPVFDKLPADLAKAMMSINAVKGFEIGSGFGCSNLRGSEHNDAMSLDGEGKVLQKTNHAGGTLGGISTGAPIYFRVAFKPVSTIGIEQTTVSTTGEEVKFSATGRHDPCVLPRAVPIVDAMAALVIMDHYLRQRSQNS